MAALDLTSFDAGLKVLYTDQRIMHIAYKDHPFLAMVPKKDNFTGKNFPLPIMYANPQGRSATFSTAQTNQVAGKYTDFVLTRKSDHGIVRIDNETIEASSDNAGAFMEARKSEVDGMLINLSASLASALFRDGSGEIGQVNAEPTENASTFVIQLKQADDVTNFEVGQYLVIFSAVSGGTQRTSDGSDNEWLVAGVNRSAGQITLSGTYDASGTIAANDYIFVEGDRGSKVSGLAAWLPATAPSSGDSFFGVDRSVDTTRLAGVISDGTGKPIEEALVDAVSAVSREGGRPSHIFMSYEKFAELEKALGSKVQYVDGKGEASVGFRGIQIFGPKGPVQVYAEQNCPSNRAYVLQMDTWVWMGLGKAPRINLSGDGMMAQRSASADAVEIRCIYRGQLGCKAPGYNAVVLL